MIDGFPAGLLDDFMPSDALVRLARLIAGFGKEGRKKGKENAREKKTDVVAPTKVHLQKQHSVPQPVQSHNKLKTLVYLSRLKVGNPQRQRVCYPTEHNKNKSSLTAGRQCARLKWTAIHTLGIPLMSSYDEDSDSLHNPPCLSLLCFLRRLRDGAPSAFPPSLTLGTRTLKFVSPPLARKSL